MITTIDLATTILLSVSRVQLPKGSLEWTPDPLESLDPSVLPLSASVSFKLSF